MKVSWQGVLNTRDISKFKGKEEEIYLKTIVFMIHIQQFQKGIFSLKAK